MYGVGNISRSLVDTLQVGNGLGKLPPMRSAVGNAFVIDYVPLTDIYTDEKNFQNRGDRYSEKSVRSIVDAVANGNFNWFAFDPVILWENPADGKKYVLSGHSRTQAFRQISKQHPDWLVDGLSFDYIPARIYRGTFDDAKRLALNSNTLATPETLTERAAYYRSIRNRQGITKGKDLKALKERALRENNGQMIWDLSYLPENGISFDSLKAFKLGEQSGSTENFLRLATICQWIGKAFQIYKGLSTAHDRELFNFLMTGGYGSKSGQYFNFTSLNDRLQKLYAKNVANDKKTNANGEYTEPFQIAAYKKDDATLDTLDNLKKDAAEAYKQLKSKLKELRENNATREQIFQVATPYFNGWANALYDWWSLLDRTPKTDNAPGLFGIPTLAEIVDGLGKPTLKFEFEDNAELLNFQKQLHYIPFDHEPMSYNSQTQEFEPLNGMTVNDKPAAVFNCPESELDCQGFKPTYRRLSDYSHLIDAADGAKTLKGYGFEKSTLEELVNACRQYKQVERLAAHLKDPDKLQSAFNIWHWLHTNVKYNYDTPGQEEIRTPARTWADRERGVDCDCLAVFTACLLINMGYTPAFEIVAFNDSPTYSHIYVNLDGVAIDRVLPIFMARPQNITKTKIMEIPVYELSGVGVGRCNTLSGVYSSTLAKIQSGTATGNDLNDFRKTQVLVTLKGIDEDAYKLAALLMPHIATIGDDGKYYFDNAKFAEIATKADAGLSLLKQQGASKEVLQNWLAEVVSDIDIADTTATATDEDTIVVVINPKGCPCRVAGNFTATELQTLSPMAQTATAQDTAAAATPSPVYATTPYPTVQPEEEKSNTKWWILGGLAAAFGLAAISKKKNGRR